MSYVRQGVLFSFEEFVQETDDNTRLVATLQALPDEGLLRWLREARRGRRDEYPQEILWRCVIAKYVYQIRTYAELIRELKRNGSLRRLVGIGSVGRVPADYHFSRFLKRLGSEKGQQQLQEIFHGLVAGLGTAMPGMGRYLAVDGTAVHAYANEQRKEKSDEDAAWSARPKRQRRSRGGGREEEYLDYWFGYVVHLVVDAETELPVAFEVTPANVNETTRFVPLLTELRAEHPEIAERTEAVLGDAGYDSVQNCAYVLREYRALPVIKMRLTQEKTAISQAATSLCTELGTQLCLSGHAMVYAGRDGDYLKWRCPVACGRASACGELGRCTTSAYGAVRKVSIHEDPRRYPGLWRESKKWTRLYRKRTAVERVNGRLKDHLLLDSLTIRGMAKVRVHVTLGLLCMLGGAAAMAEAERWGAIRQVVQRAA